MSTKRIMVFVRQDDQESRTLIEKRIKNKIADYDGSILADVDEPAVAKLKSDGFHIEEITDFDKIKLRSIVLEPSRGLPEIPVSLKPDPAESAPAIPVYWIVQMVGPARREWLESIELLGGIIGQYIPENSYLVKMLSDVRTRVAEFDFVSWTGPYQPAYKISPSLLEKREKLTADNFHEATLLDDAGEPRPLGNLRIVLHDERDIEDISRNIEDLGGTIISTDKKGIRISLTTQKVPALAAISGIQWIEPYIIPKLCNDVAAGIIGVRPVWDNHGLTGEGQIIAVADTGLDTGVNDTTMHEDFQGRITSIHSWAIPSGIHGYFDNTSWDDGASDQDSGHGTHVAGSVLGNGSRSEGEIRGIAYKANLVFQAIEQYGDLKAPYEPSYPDGYYLFGIPDDLTSLFQQSYDDGARIMTNSWGGAHDSSGNPIHGQYTTESQDIDQFVWDNRDAVILFAAGNDGLDANSDGVIDNDSLGVQATAKNCITVGATENDRPPGSTPPPGYDMTYGTFNLGNFPAAPIRNDHLSDNPDGMVAFSSRGPTDDGRIKPDVVAPGTNILSTRSSEASGNGWGLLPAGNPYRDHYMYMGGTSMATPLTAGTTALIRQYLQSACLHNPSASLVKGLLIHGAIQIVGQYATPEVGTVPDGIQGWGRVNLENALFPEFPAKLEFRDNPATTLGTGDHEEYTFNVVNTGVPFRATLAWTDYPGTPAAGGLTNRLRLSVIEPDGTTIQGDPADNNVQQVLIPSPQAGQYTVRVTGVSVPTVTMPGVGQEQDFSLAVTAGLEFVDLYIKDNAADNGVVPSVGCLYRSPDIWVSLTDDPLSPPAANPEHGQTNYVFVRTRNRGSKAAADATVRLYWANPGTNLSKPHWKTDGIKVGGVAANSLTVSLPANDGTVEGETVTAAFEWEPPAPSENSVDPGHFCLFATIDHPEDPILQEDVDKVRWESNLAWRNERVDDALPDSTTSAEFYVAGNKAPSFGDLFIDCTDAPAGARVTLKVPTRYLKGEMNGLEKDWQSKGGRKSRVALPTASRGSMTGIRFNANENTLVRLEVDLPADARDGDIYPVVVEQRVNGVTTGKVHLVARTVGTPAYIGNSNPSSGELHLPNCTWAKKIHGRNKVPYNDIDLALRRGYNGCRFCLPDYNTD